MRFDLSIGGVVYNKGAYLLLKYGLGHWGFVKGHAEKGETEKQTLMRELKEETGITEASVIGGFRKEIDYFFREKGELVKKKVVFYIVESKTRDVRLSYEHVDYKWLLYEKALKQLSFGNQREVLEQADRFIREKL